MNWKPLHVSDSHVDRSVLASNCTYSVYVSSASSLPDTTLQHKTTLCVVTTARCQTPRAAGTSSCANMAAAPSASSVRTAPPSPASPANANGAPKWNARGNQSPNFAKTKSRQDRISASENISRITATVTECFFQHRKNIWWDSRVERGDLCAKTNWIAILLLYSCFF